MATWQVFATDEPQVAALGEEMLLLGDTGTGLLGGLAYLATIRKDGGPRVHPISPVLHQGRLYAFILNNSPKRRDLLRDGRFALHSYPYPISERFTDDEFYAAGTATPMSDPAIRDYVASACGDDPRAGQVFELDLQRVMHKGRDSGELIYKIWRAR